VDRIGREIGRTLRWARRSRGLSLRAVERVSGGRFKPSSIAGYERGERKITVERFCELARFYGFPPERLLGDVVERAQLVGDGTDRVRRP
jgi:transcriptional regulator with XRE-family HTH domain